MLLLALDTATRRATAAVCDGLRPLAEGQREVTTHSEQLLPLVHEVLERAGHTMAELQAVVCGRGPGSFTGLRIGMATAKGLCFAARVPLICVSSLSSLALAVEARLGPNPERPVAAVLDARRREVFLGLFRGGAPAGPEVVCPPAEVAERLAGAGEVVLAGDGALAYREQLLASGGGRLSLAPDDCHVIEARLLAQAALPRAEAGDFDDLARAVPLYIRASDARLPAQPQDPERR